MTRYELVVYEQGGCTTLGIFNTLEEARTFRSKNIYLDFSDSRVVIKATDKTPTPLFFTTMYAFELNRVEPLLLELQDVAIPKGPLDTHLNDSSYNPWVIVYHYGEEKAEEEFKAWRAQHYLLSISLSLEGLKQSWSYLAIEKGRNAMGTEERYMGYNQSFIKVIVEYDSDIEAKETYMLMELITHINR